MYKFTCGEKGASNCPEMFMFMDYAYGHNCVCKHICDYIDIVCFCH